MLALCLFAALACAPPEVPTAEGIPSSLWSGGDRRPALDHPLFEEVAGLDDLSLYAFDVAGPLDQRPDAAHRGAFAIGNGHAFSLMGMTDPLNTFHSLVGPRYEKDSAFFGDVATTLERDGVPLEFEAEWIARVRGADILVTRADAPGVTLYTVDYSPRLGAATDDPPVLVRILAATRTGDQGGELVVRVDSHRTPEEVGGIPIESLDDGERNMGYVSWGTHLVTDDGGLSLPLGSLEPGGSVETAMVLAFGESADAIKETADRVAEATHRGWLEATLEDWQAFSARGVQLDLPDPRIEDLIDGMRTGVRVQQSAAGGVSPMSRYTGVWLRDTIGPVRFFDRAGLHDEARAALDYLHLCASVEGDYSNQCSSGLTPDDPRALANLDALLAAARRGDGTVQTPLDPDYHEALGLPIDEGLLTGMLPGYVLDNLTAGGHPEAQAAFNALHRYADPAGHYAEYMVYDDLSALQLVYDPAGGLGDYTARYRPWEGGIDIDAALGYLLGPLAPSADADLALRPHLPNGLPWLEAGPLRAGDAVASLRLERTRESLPATVRSDADASFLLQMELPAPADSLDGGSGSLDGQAAGEWITLQAGERVLRFDPISLAPGDELLFTAPLR